MAFRSPFRYPRARSIAIPSSHADVTAVPDSVGSSIPLAGVFTGYIPLAWVAVRVEITPIPLTPCRAIGVQWVNNSAG